MSTYWAQRSLRAERALKRLKTCAPEYRAQAYDEWLGLATAGEVRKHHKDWMGAFPAWAERVYARPVG